MIEIDEILRSCPVLKKLRFTQVIKHENIQTPDLELMRNLTQEYIIAWKRFQIFKYGQEFEVGVLF